MSTDNFYKNGPVACLMLHGFTGSPNELVELGEFLAGENLTVAIPKLPGHGTHSGDLFNYTWKDWFDCVKRAYTDLTRECDEVFVCGLSMGGTLALHLAAHRPVQGIISLSAAIDFPAWQKIAAKYVKHVTKFRHKRDGEDVSDRAAKAKLGSYRRYPYYAVDQLFQLVDHVRNDLSEITQPILIMHSQNDHTVDFSNAEVIFNSVCSDDKRKIDLVQSYHVITVDLEKEKVKEEVFNFIKRHSRFLNAKPQRSTSK